MTDLPILEVRRIEANIIKPIYEEMAERLGKEQAQVILGGAIEKAAIDQGNLWLMAKNRAQACVLLYLCLNAGKWVEPLKWTYCMKQTTNSILI